MAHAPQPCLPNCSDQRYWVQTHAKPRAATHMTHRSPAPCAEDMDAGWGAPPQCTRVGAQARTGRARAAHPLATTPAAGRSCSGPRRGTGAQPPACRVRRCRRGRPGALRPRPGRGRRWGRRPAQGWRRARVRRRRRAAPRRASSARSGTRSRARRRCTGRRRGGRACRRRAASGRTPCRRAGHILEKLPQHTLTAYWQSVQGSSVDFLQWNRKRCRMSSQALPGSAAAPRAAARARRQLRSADCETRYWRAGSHATPCT